MARNRNIITNLKRWFPSYPILVDKNSTLEQGTILRSRTRSNNMTQSMSMQVHDPLWMLARQWQLGEFRGNNAGTAMAVRCKIKQSSLSVGKTGNTVIKDKPLEYYVERTNIEISPLIRVEAARYYIKLLKKMHGEEVDLTSLMTEYPLSEENSSNSSKDSSSFNKCGVDDNDLRLKARELNVQLTKFLNAFKDRAFDGYKLYLDLLKLKNEGKAKSSASGVDATFIKWFEHRYLPNSEDSSSWDIKKLSYDASLESRYGKLNAKDYRGGRLSWYSFDNESAIDSTDGTEETIHSLPTLATYPGAPTKRLWEFEDYKVYMGQSTDENQTQGNVLLMQYASMYSNDWMLIPLKTQLGKYVQVKELEVWDTFGQKYSAGNINSSKQTTGIEDKGSSTYDQRWRMFNIAPETNNGKEMGGLLLPPCFASTIESKPVEEVNFVRDEMANMVWGIETLVPDGTGGSLEVCEYSQGLMDYINEKNEQNYERITGKSLNGTVSIQDSEGETKALSSHLADFKYTIQSSVALNWIPFIPQHYRGDNENRETILRRAKIPLFVYNPEHADNPAKYYLPIRPISSLIECKISHSSEKNKTIEKALFINEEEVLQTGVKIVKNYQRGRWLNGETFHWLGIKKELNKLQKNSGLVFDKLEQIKSEK